MTTGVLLKAAVPTHSSPPELEIIPKESARSKNCYRCPRRTQTTVDRVYPSHGVAKDSPNRMRTRRGWNPRLPGSSPITKGHNTVRAAATYLQSARSSPGFITHGCPSPAQVGRWWHDKQQPPPFPDPGGLSCKPQRPGRHATRAAFPGKRDPGGRPVWLESQFGTMHPVQPPPPVLSDE
jgi:hypothetical protein